MTEIKCIENLKRLNEMILKGAKGDATYFSAKLDISESTFYRLIRYLEVIGLKIKYNKTKKIYYLE